MTAARLCLSRALHLPPRVCLCTIAYPASSAYSLYSGPELLDREIAHHTCMTALHKCTTVDLPQADLPDG